MGNRPKPGPEAFPIRCRLSGSVCRDGRPLSPFEKPVRVNSSTSRCLKQTLPFAPEAVIEYAITGQIQERLGNSDKFMAPHGVYRCLGQDKWVAIAVSNEKEWAGLCKAMGNPKWTKDRKFSDTANRRTNKDELDHLIYGLDHQNRTIMRYENSTAGRCHGPGGIAQRRGIL